MKLRWFAAFSLFILLATSMFSVVCYPESDFATNLGQEGSMNGFSLAGQNPLSLAPPSILVYTEFADLDPGGEWENTMQAINNTYGTNYQYSNLTDYTNLPAQLPGNDILLIPEQEKANTTSMKTVGTTWASTLTTFVNDGGVVVLLDFGNETAPGLGLHIYNESSLMLFGPVLGQYPSAALTEMHRHTFGDALCRRIEYRWTPRNHTFAVTNTDGNNAIDDYSTDNRVVIHKIMGRGHVVFMGFDLQYTGPNYEQIVGNAIRLPNHVVIDRSQHQEFDFEFVAGDYQAAAWVEDMLDAGFAVSRMDEDNFNPSLFNASDVLICTIPYWTHQYEAAEIAAIDAFVTDGGSVFIQSDWGSFGDEIKDLTNNFGYYWAKDSIWDTDDLMRYWQESQIFFTGDNILSHPITSSVDRVEFYATDGFATLPANAERIIVSDWDGTTCWGDDGWGAEWLGADGITTMAVSKYGSGRVSVVLDGNFLDGDSDTDADSTNDYYDSDNDVLLMNTIHWLAGIETSNDAPQLSGLTHLPASPTHGDPIDVNVTAVDADGLENITCYYRDNLGAWQIVPMTPEGGDLYSAAIGTFNSSEEKDYYVRAFDSSTDKIESVSEVVYLNGINHFPDTPLLQDPGATDDDGVFLLNWTVSSDTDGFIDHYEIQVSNDSQFNTILDLIIAYTDEYEMTLTVNDTYYFKVRAVDDDGRVGFWCFQQWINVVIVEDRTGPTIATPVLTPATPEHEESVTVSANITDPRDVKNATCYYRVNSGAWQPVGMTQGIGDEYSCDIGSFLVDDFIEYYIEAYDNSTNLNMANTSIHSVTILNQPPTEPILIDPGTTITVSYLTVNWTAGSDLEDAITHYQLQLSASDDFTLILAEWNVTDTDQELTGLSNGVYYFRVRTVDDHDAASAWSNTESVEVMLGSATPTTTTTTVTSLFDPDILSLVVLVLTMGFMAIVILVIVNYMRQRTQRRYQF